jgi:hypothetical protein
MAITDHLDQPACIYKWKAMIGGIIASHESDEGW